LKRKNIEKTALQLKNNKKKLAKALTFANFCSIINMVEKEIKVILIK